MRGRLRTAIEDCPANHRLRPLIRLSSKGLRRTLACLVHHSAAKRPGDNTLWAGRRAAGTPGGGAIRAFLTGRQCRRIRPELRKRQLRATDRPNPPGSGVQRMFARFCRAWPASSGRLPGISAAEQAKQRLSVRSRARSAQPSLNQACAAPAVLVIQASTKASSCQASYLPLRPPCPATISVFSRNGPPWPAARSLAIHLAGSR